MTPEEARRVLGRAREGDESVSRHEIREALIACGDLPESDAPVVVRRPPGSWELGALPAQSLAPASWLGPIA